MAATKAKKFKIEVSKDKGRKNWTQKATVKASTGREALRQYGCNVSLNGRGAAVYTTKRGTKIRAKALA